MTGRLQRDGVRLSYADDGERGRPAVVLVHGLFQDVRGLDPVAGALVEAGYRVVRPDLRGHGRSSRGERPPKLDDLADDLVAVADAAELDRPVLVGCDVGGLAVLTLAARSPERVRAMSLWSVDPAPTPLASRLTAALVAAGRTVSIRPVTLALEPFWVRRGEGHEPALAAMHRRVASTLSASALADVVGVLADRPDLRPSLGAVDVPALVLWGSRDRLVRPTAGQELIEALPRAEGGPVDGAAHLLHVDRPVEVARRLVGWLGRL